MNVDFIFKIAAIGIVVAVLNQLLQRSGREEQAMMTTIAGLIVVPAGAANICVAVATSRAASRPWKSRRSKT